MYNYGYIQSFEVIIYHSFMIRSNFRHLFYSLITDHCYKNNIEDKEEKITLITFPSSHSVRLFYCFLQKITALHCTIFYYRLINELK